MEKTPGIEKGDVLRYDAFILNNKKVFNLDSSYLDVMSIGDVINLLRECWSDIFSAYFNGDLYSAWEAKFKKCVRARNPIAHGHEEYLSELDKQEVDIYCKQMFDMFSDTVKKISPDPEPFLEAASVFSVAIPSFVIVAPVENREGETVDMLIAEIGGMNKNNLKGVIDGKYAAFIPKNHLTGINLREKLGQRVQVRIEKIVGGRYEVSPLTWYT